MTDYLNEINKENGCPKCGSLNVEAVKYTWWGGWLGPKMFHHTRCGDCQFRFNRKTRKSNTVPIIIYSLICAGIGLAIYFLFKGGFQ
ncbi:MAG: hypothetical protein IPI66_12675 [Chitinophagaceae bacterium]|nr:hypothetical protein [Chitinophagaceae bacterium]MBL0056414.1 hypothetical protein [Chitinophagaceae bacterium]